jgi:hypothetical protein
VECRVDLLNQNAALKTEMPHLTGGRADKTDAAEE